jgi:hypothetical protein
MKKSTFVILCNLHSIYPSIALENENIVKALEAKEDDKVVQILETEF